MRDSKGQVEIRRLDNSGRYVALFPEWIEGLDIAVWLDGKLQLINYKMLLISSHPVENAEFEAEIKREFAQ